MHCSSVCCYTFLCKLLNFLCKTFLLIHDIQTLLMNVPVLPVSMEVVQTNIFITNVSVTRATRELIAKVVRWKLFPINKKNSTLKV